METGYLSGALFDGPIAEMMRDGRLRYEDYSNLTMTLRFMGGALGMPFVPANSFLGTDYLDPDVMEHEHGLAADRTRVDGTTAPNYLIMDSPFAQGEKTVLYPPLKPDAAMFHCQRADEDGNVQAWGPLADSKWALWASKQVIVSAEEIVPASVVRSDPGQTILPGFRVSAVVHNPWGAHPGPVTGYYERDRNLFATAGQPYKDWETAERFLADWVYGPEDWAAYVEQYRERFGSDLLDSLRVTNPVAPERPVRYGRL
jgi:glutaconate CoA-transferase subunit A